MRKPFLSRLAGWIRDHTPRRLQAPRPAPVPGNADEHELTVYCGEGVPTDVVAMTCLAVIRVERTLPRRNNTVTADELRALFESLTVRWVNHPVSESCWVRRVGKRWVLTLEQPNERGSELFHALFHLINRAVRLPLVAEHQRERFLRHDDEHTEREWWAIIDEVRAN